MLLKCPGLGTKWTWGPIALVHSASRQLFQVFFFHFVQILSVKIIKDPVTNYSFGYGFVEYSRPEDAARAIQTLKGYPIQNKRLGVTLSRVYKKEDLKNTNLVKIIK